MRRTALVLVLLLAGCSTFDAAPPANTVDTYRAAARTAIQRGVTTAEVPSGAGASIAAQAATYAAIAKDLDALRPPADLAAEHRDAVAKAKVVVEAATAAGAACEEDDAAGTIGPACRQAVDAYGTTTRAFAAAAATLIT